MNQPSRRSGRALITIAILCAGSGAVEAQPASRQRDTDHFIRTRSHVLNRNHIDRVEFGATGDGSKAVARVYFAGSRDALMLVGEDAEQVRSAFEGGIAGHGGGKETSAGGSRVLAFDDFEGKSGLNWKPVRPDPSHASLAKNPGKLTITTQRGSIHGEETKDEFGEGVQAKNLYLIDNPLAKDADFVVTTCVSGFTPATPYQQAGLIIYDDNYLKLGYEFDWHRGEGQTFYCVLEEDAVPDHHPVAGSESGLTRYWLRLTRRGDRYGYATSTDGKTFRAHGEVTWVHGSPKRVGVLAKNGGSKDAPEADAAFEFFELRSPVAPEGGED